MAKTTSCCCCYYVCNTEQKEKPTPQERDAIYTKLLQDCNCELIKAVEW